MRGKRMWQTLRLFMTLSADKRTKYYKEKNIFYAMGENCLIMDRKVPLYAKLISLGDNVQIASNVSFNTHDITHRMLNNMNIPSAEGPSGKAVFHERIGCIEIGDNVFIGAGTTINYNVRIGSNVIIGSSSVITKDIPDNCVAAGVPAKVICSFEEYLKKRQKNDVQNEKFGSEMLDDKVVDEMWRVFHSEKNA